MVVVVKLVVELVELLPNVKTCSFLVQMFYCVPTIFVVKVQTSLTFFLLYGCFLSLFSLLYRGCFVLMVLSGLE